MGFADCKVIGIVGVLVLRVPFNGYRRFGL